MRFGRLLFGLLSGLTFGMLFAPKKGKDLRKEIMKKSSLSNAEGLKVLGQAFLEAGTEAYEEFQKLSETEQVKALKTLSKEKLDDFLVTAKEKGYEVAEHVQEKLGKATDFFKEEAEEIEEALKKPPYKRPRKKD